MYAVLAFSIYVKIYFNIKRHMYCSTVLLNAFFVWISVLILCASPKQESHDCLFVTKQSKVCGKLGASRPQKGHGRNYWTRVEWQRELAQGSSRCCNHKEIHKSWIKYEALRHGKHRPGKTWIIAVLQAFWMQQEHRLIVARGKCKEIPVNINSLDYVKKR